MKQVVWKFPLTNGETQIFRMPKGAQILDVQVQYETFVLWALVDPRIPYEDRTLVRLNTGDIVPDMEYYRHISTLQFRGDVSHFFIKYKDDELPWRHIPG